jgi:prophage regulatory protein
MKSSAAKITGNQEVFDIAPKINRATRRTVARILRRAEVRHLTGLPYSTMYKLMRAGLFPEKFRIPGTNAVGWDYEEVVAWVEKTIADAKLSRREPVTIDQPKAKPAKRAAVEAKPAPKRVGRPLGTTKEVLAKRRRKEAAVEAG